MTDQNKSYKYDVFISYSRKNEEFASQLEQALESYKPEKDLKVPQRFVEAFRDKEDFTGGNYHKSLLKNLADSSKLIVICSPDARKSKYVNDEIKEFIDVRGSDHIIPVLFSGVPNNEAKIGQEDEMAFPEELCKAIEMPLAVNYLGFDTKKDKINKGIFISSWYSILADTYELSRSEMEQREKRRRVRQRRITVSVLSGSLLVLSVLLIFALVSKSQAVTARDEAKAAQTAEKEQRDIAERKTVEATEQRDIAVEAERKTQESLANEKTAKELAEIKRKEAEEAAKNERLAKDQAEERRKQAEKARENETVAKNQAEEKRKEAERQTSISQARELILSSEANIKKDIQLSLLLSIAAAEKFTKAEGKIDPKAEETLRRAVSVAMPRVLTDTDGIETITWTPNGQLLAAGSSDGKVAVISVKDMNVIYTLDVKGWVNTVDFNDDGTLLAAGGKEHTVTIWKVENKEKLGQLTFNDEVTSVSWRKNSKQIAVALARGDGSVVQIYDWNQMQSKQLYEVSGIRGKFSPNGELLATGGGDGIVRIFNSNGILLAEMPGHERYVHNISWTSDNRRFATASVDDKVIVWDAINPKILKVLPAKFALGVAWSPNNSHLVSSSGEGKVAVWDGNLYTPVFDFTNSQTITGDEIEDSGPRGYILDVGFNPKGDLLAASERGGLGGKGSVLFFPSSMLNSLNEKNWLELAKKFRRRSLTNKECQEFFHRSNC